jgi:hypothetical protein
LEQACRARRDETGADHQLGRRGRDAAANHQVADDADGDGALGDRRQAREMRAVEEEAVCAALA